MLTVGIACDHGGFDLKEDLVKRLRLAGFVVTDFGASEKNENDDYPDYVVPLARAVAAGEVSRGVAVCGSGVGASIAANKVAGTRAALIHDTFSAHQGVEDDDMNMVCLGGRVVGTEMAWELVSAFLAASFMAEERFVRRLSKISLLEKKGST